MAIVNAYPNFIDRIEGNDLVWQDGTRMPVDDGKGYDTMHFEHRPEIIAAAK